MFFQVREKVGNLLDLQAVPYPDLMDDLRDLAVTASAIFLVNHDLYNDVPGFSTLNLYVHRSYQAVAYFRNVMFIYFDNSLIKLVHEIHAHTSEHARELGYVFYPQHQAVFFVTPIRPVRNTKNSFLHCE